MLQILYPWLLSSESFIALFKRGDITVRLDDLAYTAAGTLLLPSLGWFLSLCMANAGRLAREERPSRIRLGTVVCVFFFFAYNHIPEGHRSLTYWSLFLGLAAVGPLVPVLALPSSSIKGLERFISIWVTVLLSFTSVHVLSQHLRGKATLSFFAIPPKVPALTPSTPSTPSKVLQALSPDIYLFILDGYGGSVALKQEYGEDNADFLGSLRGLGFYNHPEMISNYLRTELAMSAVLNGDFVQNIFPKEVLKAPGAYTGKLQEHWVNTVLRSKGYTTVHIGSGVWSSFSNPTADVNLIQSPQREVLSVYMRRSLLDPLRAALFFREDIRRIEFSFKSLREISRSVSSPKFVFVHILAPHPPYVLSESGESEPLLQFKRKSDVVGHIWTEKEAYIDQMKALNRRLLSALDGILKNSTKPPVILAMGDHGPASYFYKEVNQTNVSKRGLQERTSVLFSVLTPRVCREEFSKLKSTVNTFPALFRCLFAEKPEYREDRVFHSLLASPNRLVDVTSILRTSAGYKNSNH